MSMRPRRVKYRVLGENECRRIHQASLETLERTGCKVEAQEAMDLLQQAGAYVEGDRVRIPSGLVQQALQSAPRKIALYSRLGQRAMILEGTNTYYGTGSDCPFTLDLESGARRKSSKSDVASFARLVDGLPNIDFVMSMGIASDANEFTSFVHQFQAMVENTIKPIVFTTHGIEDMRDIYEMAVAVKGSAERLKQEPFLLLYSEPIPPQRHTRMGLEKLIYCARNHVPVTYPTGAMAGCSAPATLAGAVALGNAETLAGLVIHQLASPGAPYVYGGNTTVMDMSTGLFTYAAPEFHLTFSAYADLGKFYGLPVWALAGASDSKTLDAQAGMEAGYQMIMAELSGAQLIHDVGYLDSGLCSSMELVCLGNEMASLARHISRGIRVEPEDFALDVIDEVGPGGMFLATDHTVETFRREFWFPKVLVRGSFDSWREGGSLNIYQRLNQQASQILASHQPSALPEEVRVALDQIIKKREASLRDPNRTAE